MKHLNDNTQGNLYNLLGHTSLLIEFEELSLGHVLQQTRLDDQKNTTLPLVYPHCLVPRHHCHSPAESELPLHGLPVLLSEVESCPTACEVRETDGTDIFTSSVLHQLVYMCSVP